MNLLPKILLFLNLISVILCFIMNYINSKRLENVLSLYSELKSDKQKEIYKYFDETRIFLHILIIVGTIIFTNLGDTVFNGILRLNFVDVSIIFTSFAFIFTIPTFLEVLTEFISNIYYNEFKFKRKIIKYNLSNSIHEVKKSDELLSEIELLDNDQLTQKLIEEVIKFYLMTRVAEELTGELTDESLTLITNQLDVIDRLITDLKEDSKKKFIYSPKSLIREQNIKRIFEL